MHIIQRYNVNTQNRPNKHGLTTNQPDKWQADISLRSHKIIALHDNEIKQFLYSVFFYIIFPLIFYVFVAIYEVLPFCWPFLFLLYFLIFCYLWVILIFFIFEIRECSNNNSKEAKTKNTPNSSTFATT